MNKKNKTLSPYEKWLKKISELSGYSFRDISIIPGICWFFKKKESKKDCLRWIKEKMEKSK